MLRVNEVRGESLDRVDEIVRIGSIGVDEIAGARRGGVEGVAWGRRDDGGMVGRGGVCV